VVGQGDEANGSRAVQPRAARHRSECSPAVREVFIMAGEPSYRKLKPRRTKAKGQKERISLMIALSAACCFLLYYFHQVLCGDTQDGRQGNSRTIASALSLYEGALYVRVHGQFHCASGCFGGGTQFFAKAFFTASFAS